MRIWRWTGTGVGYLRRCHFACCLVCFACGGSVPYDEFSLNGITEATGVDEAPALLCTLPSHLNLWSLLRSGTSSCEATRRPAKIDLCRLSQSLSFWDTSRIRAWTIWHGQQALNEWLVKQFPHETSRCPQQRLRPWRLVFVQFPSIYYRLWLWHTKSEATKSGWKLHKWICWRNIRNTFCLKSATAKCDISMLNIVGAFKRSQRDSNPYGCLCCWNKEVDDQSRFW